MNIKIKVILITLSFVFFHIHIISQKEVEDTSNITKIDLVFIEKGAFKRGDKNGEVDEKPVRKIKIESFYIGKYEVSNSEFVEFLNVNGNQVEGNTQWINLDGKWNNLKCRIYEKNNRFFVEEGYEYFPVNFVSWYGAKAYCLWKGGRLPTEAEWEYVAKGGKYSKKQIIKEFEKNISKYSWYFYNSDNQMHKRGQKASNTLGLFDIYGNLWEWCSDFYNANYYTTKINKNPQGPISGDYKVIRGGSWTNKEEMMRISNRNAINPNSNKINLGFRIAFSIKKTENGN
jgi:sulfatase modifying factor 1